MKNFSNTLNNFFKRKSIKYGVPFLIVVVGGSFGLKEFTQLRYQFSKISQIRPDELKKKGIEMKKPGEVTLESEFEKLKQLDIDDWKQVRGPRPWEENVEN
ncbi:hypothetical protein NQ315_011431 [Exocentrus adspersus]|uniref:Cytochrome c oxidase assembly protein COX16 homolog, mitochondrial n=1 Tax=Exocentrus adspersus TaxID=1586481 RepID=A0AAV8VUL3_9CUCU|nr:hypothetical protein NQ315_011431 [Exocentrus adspersus]